MKMRTWVLAAGFLATGALTATVSAQAEPLSIARNAKVVSSDGQDIGLVNRVLTGADQNVSAIRIIMGSRLVTLSADQLSVEGGVVTTRLTKKEVERSH
ncbi:hypothetical protein WG907_13950 [Sphingobium sp. AN558]|uniref:hypothetical protein n=1 Tax=Sphingobium sp. AN558 TaxID=3133442 RepID=UPI0030C11B15